MTDETPTSEPTAPTFTSYRQMVDWIADQLRVGAMWGSWVDGRFTFGDNIVNSEPDAADGVRIDPADEYEVGVMAASIASKMVALASMPQEPPPGPNRAQRRAASNGKKTQGLWTPGR